MWNMGDWPPDEVREVAWRQLYLWRIPIPPH
jgi:hypothetical protein